MEKELSIKDLEKLKKRKYQKGWKNIKIRDNTNNQNRKDIENFGYREV